MKVCSFGFCYYNILENVLKDKTNVQAFSCEHCSQAIYHSEFCKKLDKDHLKSCTGNKNKTVEGKPKLQKVLNIDNKENVHSNLPLDTSRLMKKSLEPTNIKADYSNTIKLNNYEIFMKKSLGSGSYGKVVMGREILTNVEVAVKIVDKAFLQQNSQAILLKREIYIQRRLHHQNILALRDVFEDDQHIYLVLEYCSGGSLFDYIQKKGGLSEKETFVFFLQVCLAIETLHKNRIVHRDIKPENLLLDKAKNLKVCDFGCSFQFLKNTPKIRKTYCGTVDYMAPEFFKKQPHGMAADVWALGVLLFEMAHGNPPFNVEEEDNKISMILESEEQQFEYKAGITEEFKDLVERILRHDAKDRPTFDEIFSHAWIELYAGKLNIDVQRIRFREVLFDENEQREMNEFFNKCELRPTEVVMFADDTYMDELKMSSDKLTRKLSHLKCEEYSYGDLDCKTDMNNVNILTMLGQSRRSTEVNRTAGTKSVNDSRVLAAKSANVEHPKPVVRASETEKVRITKRQTKQSVVSQRTKKPSVKPNMQVVVLDSIVVEESKPAPQRNKSAQPAVFRTDNQTQTSQMTFKSSKRNDACQQENRQSKSVSRSVVIF